jgi:hypothetical protein
MRLARRRGHLRLRLYRGARRVAAPGRVLERRRGQTRGRARGWTSPCEDWSLTSSKEKLIKIARRSSATVAMSPSRWPRSPFPGKCFRRFAADCSCGWSRCPHQPKPTDGHAFKIARREDCAQIARKIKRFGPKKWPFRDRIACDRPPTGPALPGHRENRYHRPKFGVHPGNPG